MELSQIENETLRAIYELLQEQWERGIPIANPPTVRQIMPLVNRHSTSVVRHRIFLLESKGLVAHQDYSGGVLTRLTTKGLELAKELYD